MLLSKVLTLSCMFIHNIVEENIFAAIVYKLLEQQRYWNAIKHCFKINGK